MVVGICFRNRLSWGEYGLLIACGDVIAAFLVDIGAVLVQIRARSFIRGA